MAKDGTRFNDWLDSAYYPLLYFDRNRPDAEAFVTRLLKYLKPPPGARILQLSAGRGLLSPVIAGYGFNVTAIDGSYTNINVARKHESDRLQFFQHDLRLPFWINYFDYAFYLFGGFGHFRTEREHGNVIRTIANSLKPGGWLLFDYPNMNFCERLEKDESMVTVDGIDFTITPWFDDTHFYRKIVVNDPKLDKPMEYIEQLAKLNLGDVNDMLAFHHLQTQEVFGDYELKPYDVKSSPRLIISARKTPRLS